MESTGTQSFAEDESSRKTKHILRTVFFFYILVLLKVIVLSIPLRGWAIRCFLDKEVVWEGLGTANFTLFKTIRMYIRYWGKLNSFENLFGNVLAFVPLGFLLPFLQRRAVDSGFCFWTRSCLSAVSSCFSFYGIRRI